MARSKRGQVLPVVMVALVVLSLVIAALIRWMQHDSLWAVKDQKSTAAINLAEAAIDRGAWKLQSSTYTWSQAAAGATIAGFNFDVTYYDVPGGSYRIRFATSTGGMVTIVGEGRDTANKETRAISALFLNQTIYSPLMAGGMVTWARGLGVYWGPIMSQGNIQLMDDFVASQYYPRKFARGSVIGTAANPRDTNGLTPPNTDNTEWWSEYAGVPDVPILDFAALRSSAAATGTLNVYGCRNSTPVGAWDARSSCGSTGSHNLHFGNSWNHPLGARFSPSTPYVWYWDGDVTLSGAYCGGSACNQSAGLRGSVIVRGNLTIDTPGEYNYTGPVPTNAWLEHQKLLIATNDTSASSEYPADTGLRSNSSTFAFGTASWCQPGQGCGWRTTVGIRGFTYVGGNLTILQFLDFNGAVWVNGTVTASGGSATAFCGIFYDNTLSVPALNVILQRQSWQEIAPSKTVWM